jgi:hypothetical protein
LLSITPFKCSRCSAYIGETDGLELKLGGLRVNKTVTGACDACGRSVRWTKPAVQLPLTDIKPEVAKPSQLPILSTVKQSLADADQDRHRINADARPPRRDRDIDRAEAEQDDKYFSTLAKSDHMRLAQTSSF